MGRVLLLYATREGQTAKVASRITAFLSQRGHAVELVNTADSERTAAFDLSAFDLVVCGASMHAGGLEREFERYLKAHATQLERLPRSLFVVLLAAATQDPEERRTVLADARNKVKQRLAVPFEDIEFIAGALRYSKYSLPLKWIMKRIARSAGGDTDTSQDYEYTDWDLVDGYAARLAGRADPEAPSGNAS